MKPSFEYVIPLAPVTKKNSQRILFNRNTGRPFVMPSKAYKDYEAAALRQLLGPLPPEPIDWPVNVMCVFYMPSRRKVDKTNLEESAHDILVKAGVLEDDSRDIIATTDGSIVMHDKQNPRTVITITEKVGYEQWAKK